MVRSQQATVFVTGTLLMGLGGLFLIAQLLGGHFWAYFWPYPIIAVGLTFLAAMVTRGRGAGGLAVPGTIITTIGFILFIQNSFGWWESWAFAWTFIVISVGAGILIMGYWNGSERTMRNGLRIALIGLLLLMLFGTFFGLGFSFLGFGFAARVIWPLIMVGIGAILIMRGIVTHSLRSSIGTDTKAVPAAQPHPMPSRSEEAAPAHSVTV
jgi:hypothetical protein